MLNPLDFIKTYAIYALLAVAAVAAIGWAGWGVQTYRIRGMELTKATAEAKAQKAARDKEAENALVIQEITNAKENQLRDVAAERDTALLSLRNRPRNRLPPAADAACLGASPAALNAEDASVAVGYGAEFDALRAEYATCKAFTEMKR